MKAQIEIKMDNAAFESDGCDGYMELARILHKLANELQDNGSRNVSLFDVNGNRVGKFEVSDLSEDTNDYNERFSTNLRG